MGFFDSLPLVLGHPAVADAIRRQAQANRAATAAQAPAAQTGSEAQV